MEVEDVGHLVGVELDGGDRGNLEGPRRPGRDFEEGGGRGVEIPKQLFLELKARPRVRYLHFGDGASPARLRPRHGRPRQSRPSRRGRGGM
jgi:hypothetical protein